MASNLRCPGGVPARALVVVIAAALARTAAADPSFAWQAPSACPTADDVRLRIERRLGHPLDPASAGITVAVAIEPAGYVARVDAGTEARTLTSAHCDDLADAVAVVVARLATEARRSQPAASPRTATFAAPVAIDAEEAPRPPRPWGGGVRALGLSGIGRVPSIGLGGELAVFLHHRDRFAEIAVAKWVAPRLVTPTGDLDIGLDVLAVRAGWAPEHMPIRGWLAGELGMRAGDAVMGPSRWTAVGAGFGVAWPMSPELRLVGTFEVDVPIQRPPVDSNGAEVFRPSWLTAHTALGLEVAWL
jgi:hypothetical protein